MKLLCAVFMLLSACSTLGPVPVATGISPIPRARFDGELQLGAMPGYYMSAATVKEPKGAPLAQFSAVIEPGAAVPGLIVGGRIFGPGHDTLADPLLGYRASIGADRRISIAIVGFGSKSSSTEKSASYTMTRGGAEVSGDLRLGVQRPWFEPHINLGLSVTALEASGDYCENPEGYGADCPDPPALPILHHSSASGVYPAVTAGATLLVGHHHESWIHGARALVLIGAGLMPRVMNDVQVGGQPYVSIGLALSISVGAPR
ncbi:MAG TPA: hypothetical protein VL463_18060 [Kofleriaceae bacterium]|nr:hypothetical protein [Kofleriaceae bacterium]